MFGKVWNTGKSRWELEREDPGDEHFDDLAQNLKSHQNRSPCSIPFPTFIMAHCTLQKIFTVEDGSNGQI